MKHILVLEFLFFIGSIIGWIIEIFFRKIVSTKRWINPGFLTGPYLPIYGFGLCLLYGLSKIDISFISNEIIQKIFVLIMMTISLTLVEYIAGIIFIKGMKVKLWDYSDRWGNIDGIICPKFSLFWGIGGAIYYFFINPYIINAVIWLFDNLAFSYVIGYFFGILTIDAINSFNITVKLRRFAKENGILVKFEGLKKYIRERQIEQKQKVHYLLPFNTNEEFRKVLEEYKKKIRQYETERHKKMIALFNKNKTN